MNLSYSQKVIDLMRRPKNMGEIKAADGVATVGNPVCGDVMKLFIKVTKRQRDKETNPEEYISQIKFQTLGCPAAIATSSILTEMAKGKTIKQALKINNQMIVKQLGGLPQTKLHCSVLASRALKKAIKNYQENKK